MISATKWVPRGVAAEFPTKVELDEEEMARISNLARMQLDDARLDLAEADAQGAYPPLEDEEDNDSSNEKEDDSDDWEDESEAAKSAKLSEDAEKATKQVETAAAKANNDEDELAEYNMDDYDDEPQSAAMSAISNVRGLAYHAPDEEDTYLTLPNAQDVEDEREELRIARTDNLILAAKTEDDVSILEVYVYNEEAESDTSALYVHHDLMLPSFPLSVEWISCQVGKSVSGNLAAVGTFSPEIEIWDLDVVDSMYPAAILGQKPEDAKIEARGTGKKRSKLKQPNPDYHVDAVLSLAANPHHPNLLASGSADTTIKLWDLQTCKAVKSFDYHTSKVSSVAWNPVEPTVLLSGGYDHYARVADLQADDVKAAVRSYKVEGDVESVKWHPDGIHLFVATDKGTIYKFDAREEGKPVWTLQAHDGEITSFDINAFASDYMVTGSSDKQVKLWTLANDRPSMLLSRDLDVGRVFSVAFGPEEATAGLLSVAGSDGRLKVWNTFSNKTVRSQIAPKYVPKGDDQIAVAASGGEESEDED